VKHYDVIEGQAAYRFFYDRLKGSESTKTKEKKVMCKNCKKYWGGKDLEKRHDHRCSIPFVGSNAKSGYELAKVYRASYEDEPNTIQSLVLLIVDSNSSFTLANSKFITKLLLSCGVPRGVVRYAL
jgi:hypothetical protein